MNFRDLKANEIDVRVGQVGDGYCTLLLYKDARVDMDILDETVGSNSWQRRHYEVKGNMYCSVGIKTFDSEWVWKDDCGTESNTEKEKGESSDSFKRACVNWGIGRELYTSPLIKVNCKTKDKKVQDLTAFSVADIVIENKAITGLQIKAYDKENKTTDIVFSWGKLKGEKKEEKKELTLEEAENMVIKRKDGTEAKLKDLDVVDLGNILNVDKPSLDKIKEGAKLILKAKENGN